MRAELVATRLTASGGMGGLGAGAEQIILLKPRTFMNESGQSVVKALAYYKTVSYTHLDVYKRQT